MACDVEKIYFGSIRDEILITEATDREHNSAELLTNAWNFEPAASEREIWTSNA